MGWIHLKNLMKLAFLIVTGKVFWNYRIYSKYPPKNGRRGAFYIAQRTPIAIVVQGPVVYESDFTLESLRMYRENFPEATIVLSTWEVTLEFEKALKEIDIHLIQNEHPSNAGISNINLQIVTSRAGILCAKEQGALYVLKTRTDHRIYHPSLDSYLYNVIRAFPLSISLLNQKHRLVGISLNSFKYRMYGVSDMFLFGYIDDMVLFWDIPLDKRIYNNEERKKAGFTWRTFAHWRVCEVYLCTEYLDSIGRNLKYSLRDSFQMLRDHFVIIDQSAIQLYWHKYTMNEERYSNFGFQNPEISFNDWLVIYQSMDSLEVDENILDRAINHEN